MDGQTQSFDNPIRRERRLSTDLMGWTQHLLESTLAPAPTVTPFKMQPWDNPRAANRSVSLRTDITWRQIADPSYFPAVRTELPPRAPQRAIGLRTWIDTGSLILLLPFFRAYWGLGSNIIIKSH